MKRLDIRRVREVYFARFGGLFITASLCLYAAQFVPAQKPLSSTVITGRIVGGDGQPMPKAFAALSRGYSWIKTVDVSEADKDGNFRLTTNKRGLFYIVFHGLNHPNETIVVWIDRPKKIGINVKLSVPEYQEDLSAARAANTSFKKQPDGTYLLELTTSQPTLR